MLTHASILRKVAAAVLSAAVLAAGVLMPALDRDTGVATARFDVSHDGPCGPLPHNHAYCVVLAASSQLAVPQQLPVFSAPVRVETGLPTAARRAARFEAATHRSRAPPRV